MNANIAALRERPAVVFARRLRSVFFLTFWLPLLFILVDRGFPPLPIAGYALAVLAVAAVFHGFETLRDRGRTALVPIALRLDAEGLQLDVRNIGNSEAQTCDVMAWVVAVPADAAYDSFEASAQRLPADGRPHYSQRVVAMSPGEAVLGQRLARASGSRLVIRPGRYHVKWRTATTDRQDRRTSLEGWVATEVT